MLIVTDHSAYDWDWIVEQRRLVVDTRNATRDVNAHREPDRKGVTQTFKLATQG